MDPEHIDVTVTSSSAAADSADSTWSPDTAEDDLAGGLAALAGLSSARLSLEDLLTRVASFAVQAILGADGAG